jgi:hypothetical protein
METEMNWDHLYGSVWKIKSEASWMLGQLREFEEEGKIATPSFVEARTLVEALHGVASGEVLVEVRNLFDVLVVTPVAAPAPGSDPLPAPAVSAQRIVRILDETARPIGELIRELTSGDRDGRLGMLLMAGMTGVFTATKAVAGELAEIVGGEIQASD